MICNIAFTKSKLIIAQGGYSRTKFRSPPRGHTRRSCCLHLDKNLLQSLFSVFQELRDTIGKIKSHPVGQDSQPPHTFANLSRQLVLRIRRPAPFMTHRQAPYQTGICQKSQSIFLNGPFRTMIFPFQCMIRRPDSRPCRRSPAHTCRSFSELEPKKEPAHNCAQVR